LRAVTEHRDLTGDDMASVMRKIMTGEATPAQIGGFLIGLRMKGETIDEISAAAQVMRSLATRVQSNVSDLVDVVGTGGDGLNTFNISTASAFVVAAAGGHVAKHGNRSASSKSGSADLLEAAGAKLDLNAEQVGRCIQEIGVGFMFAPLHHGAMKHAIGPRREMAARTIFNILGPLTNPAGAPNQLLGVFDKKLVEPLALVLAKLGSRHVLVVHAEDGMDEISIGAPTHVAELKDGEVKCYSITPQQFGFDRGDIVELAVDSAEHSLSVVTGIFDDKPGPTRDVVVLNAGAAIYACGHADSIDIGIIKARESVGSGAARDKLAEFIRFTNVV
ncbi:MAG: anthranilate phosphoribosyltransferase, partial [Gammaproteobacteria bacterium]|nr:anthranilate phosphoribosyltransferase [Gammaproteobacteria bacterium]